MEIPNELLIEVGLNVVGFVLAGLLMAVIYSMIGRKNKSAANFETYSTARGHQAPGHTGAKIEFIDFQSKGKRDAATNMNLTGENNQFERNRLEIIRQAREMLNVGKMSGVNSRNVFADGSGYQAANQRQKVIAKRGAANDQ